MPKRKRWEPKVKEKYWYLDSWMQVEWALYDPTGYSNYCTGNCFRTRAQAIKAKRRMKAALREVHEEATND